MRLIWQSRATSTNGNQKIPFECRLGIMWWEGTVLILKIIYQARTEQTKRNHNSKRKHTVPMLDVLCNCDQHLECVLPTLQGNFASWKRLLTWRRPSTWKGGIFWSDNTEWSLYLRADWSLPPDWPSVDSLQSWNAHKWTLLPQSFWSTLRRSWMFIYPWLCLSKLFRSR